MTRRCNYASHTGARQANAADFVDGRFNRQHFLFIDAHRGTRLQAIELPAYRKPPVGGEHANA